MNWLKMEHCLFEKPEVVAMATSLDMDRFAVAGRCLRIWAWFDSQTQTGNAPGVTPSFIDSLVAHEGFAAAMTAAGWLASREGRLAVPNFDRHISKSAKTRALVAERVKRTRNAPTVSVSISDSDSFSLFWKAFPAGRKKSKRRAREAFDRACKRADSSVIISAAADYAASDEGRGQYVKMPETWLNGDCWEDDRAAWKNRDGARLPPPDRSILESRRQSNGVLKY